MTDLEDLVFLALHRKGAFVIAPCAAPQEEDGISTSKPFDQARIERAVREILLAIGEDPDRDGLLDTPRRVARSYAELFRGMQQSPGAHLRRVFEQKHDDLILVRNIELFSVCEHHLLPFFGKAHIGYLPGDARVVGLSKLARTVEVFARRPQVQERLTNQIANALEHYLRPRGVVVAIEAEHLCMKMRGVQKNSSVMVTSTLRGIYREDRQAGAHALGIMLRSRG